MGCRVGRDRLRKYLVSAVLEYLGQDMQHRLAYRGRWPLHRELGHCGESRWFVSAPVLTQAVGPVRASRVETFCSIAAAYTDLATGIFVVAG